MTEVVVSFASRSPLDESAAVLRVFGDSTGLGVSIRGPDGLTDPGFVRVWGGGEVPARLTPSFHDRALARLGGIGALRVRLAIADERSVRTLSIPFAGLR